jgi:hypothetical protein
MDKEPNLLPEERERLSVLEGVVKSGLQTFVEVGLALAEIRDRRLYRQTHATFETYLDERWSMSRSRGYRLIDGARVAQLVSPIGDIANEAQARELVPLLDQPEELTEAWEEAMHVSNGKPTAATITESVKRRRITDEDRSRMLALHDEGKDQKQISDLTGWAQSTVSRTIRAAATDISKLPKRRQAATPQTRALRNLQRACRDWDELGDEEYIPAPELARRIRVLDGAMTFITRKRDHYYALTEKDKP